MRREMDPELTITVGWNHEAGYGGALDTSIIGADQHGISTARQAQHFQAKRGHNFPLRLHYNWHAPHDAITFGADSEQTVPGGGFFKDWHVAQQSWIVQQISPGVAANGRNTDRLVG